MPYWHEAEVGYQGGRFKKGQVRKEGKIMPSASAEAPDFKKPAFPDPAVRWPTQEEAQHYGYQSVRDWYVDVRAGSGPNSSEEKVREAHVEFGQLEQRQEEIRKEESDEEIDEAFIVTSLDCMGQATRDTQLVSELPPKGPVSYTHLTLPTIYSV